MPGVIFLRMDHHNLISQLGYADSPNFVHGDELASSTDHSHIFRRAKKRLKLQGVYTLQQPMAKGTKRKPTVPVVYICDAETEEEAHEIRRLTWNQNAAPFLIVRTPTCIRLFSSFNCPMGSAGKNRGTNNLDQRIEFDQISSSLRGFSVGCINDGTIWDEYGHFVTPTTRVDWSLLKSLEQLDAALIADGLDRRTSHALIGKYVYLWYLRHRDILSKRRLADWKIDPDAVFSRNATLTSVRSTLDYLDEWLNGSVFPLEWTRSTAPRQEHLRKVAAVFAGDTLNGQLHLPFDAYDFSIIPVETLSAIYEQFLHAHEPQDGKPRGEALGAYYTPVHLVNFMLEELNDRQSFQEGMTCLDPSCGSGAFLVQCYRRLIEARIRKDGKAVRRPAELRELLVNHIFGVDRDGDACRVTELSLILTLLDYVDPPDLSPVHNFKLPNLRDTNIFEADFFNSASTWTHARAHTQYDWIVGNPPWVELKGVEGKPEEQHVRAWIKDNTNKYPISGKQLAEAFLWKAKTHLATSGVIGLLAPAMTLFKDEAMQFRKRFFADNDVWCVANFANLAYVLFGDRVHVGAAAFFYSAKHSNDRSPILCYSPLIAGQKANQPDEPGAQKETWNLTISSSEIRQVEFEDAIAGDPLVWKTAMWGSYLDRRLLTSLAAKFGSLHEVCKPLEIKIHQGVELRKRKTDKKEKVDTAPQTSEDTLEYVAELVDQKIVDFKKLRKCGRIYRLPDHAISRIGKQEAYWRVKGGPKGIEVCRPPHIIVDSARRFAIFSDEFVAIRHWHVGIAGGSAHADLLKAISLFLSSDFATYHQFLCSPKWGIHASIAGLDTLRAIPFPVDSIRGQSLTRWTRLHTAITKERPIVPQEKSPSLYQAQSHTSDFHRLQDELNELTNDALGLHETERWLVSDLVHVRLELIQGKVGAIAIEAPSLPEMTAYCDALAAQLNAFVEVATAERYNVQVIYDSNNAMIALRRSGGSASQDKVKIVQANSDTAKALRGIRQSLLEKHSQWVYFDRALRCYLNGMIYLFKPMQRIHWVKSQALTDSAEIIADCADGGPQ